MHFTLRIRKMLSFTKVNASTLLAHIVDEVARCRYLVGRIWLSIVHPSKLYEYTLIEYFKSHLNWLGKRFSMRCLNGIASRPQNISSDSIKLD